MARITTRALLAMHAARILNKKGQKAFGQLSPDPNQASIVSSVCVTCAAGSMALWAWLAMGQKEKG